MLTFVTSLNYLMPDEISSHKLHKHRIEALDALRGFAAFAVMLGHLMPFLVSIRAFRFSPVYFISAGHEAVVFFFVLSGFVLTYQYHDDPKFSYRNFIIQRLFRLYLPYIASILLSLTLLYATQLYLNSFKLITGFDMLKWSVFFQHIVLVGNFNSNALNPVIWSLVHEMRISLLFPFVLYLVRLKPYKSFSIIVSIVSIGISLNYLGIDPSLGYNNSYAYSANYFYMFMGGALIAKHRVQLLAVYDKLSNPKKTMLMILAVFVYNYAHFGPNVIGKLPFKNLLTVIAGRQSEDLLGFVASCLLLVSAIAVSRKANFLNTHILLFLGKISYSLYLVHFPIFQLVFFMLHGKVSQAALICLCLIVSLTTAVIFNKYVEQGAVNLFKKYISKNNTGKPARV